LLLATVFNSTFLSTGDVTGYSPEKIKISRISRKSQESAPEIRRFMIRRKSTKPGDSWSNQEIWHA
jgi:hypothetical protein